MRLKAPQPRQSFFNIAPSGHTFHSDDYGFIEVKEEIDARTLRAMGCVDAPARTDPKPAPDEPTNERSAAMHGLSPYGQEDEASEK